MIRRSKTLGGLIPQNRLGAASQLDPVVVTWEEEDEERRKRRRSEKKRTVVLPHELVVSEVLARLACKPLMRLNKMYDGFTQVVDGLFCANRGNRMWVCKVSTGSSIELPPCFNYPRRQKSRFYLGFDCTRKEYKLLTLCFCRDPGGEDFYFPPDYEILTLGKDAEWRSIPSGHLIDYLGETVFLHGNSTLFFWPKYGRSVLVAFSFKEELFDVVVLPPWPFRGEDHRDSLLQFGDHLALVEEFFDQELELWVYGGKMPGEEENRGGKQDVDVDVVDDYVDDFEEEEDNPWTKHIINIPYAFRRHGFSLLGNLPTGEILMTGTLIAEDEEEINNSNNKPPPLETVMPPLYSYDPSKEKFQELVIGNKFQTSPLPFISIGTYTNKLRIYQYVEDVRPLENLIRGDESNLGRT
ncbi:hypothetical protein RHMOL_Rhmol04G0250400 [Rhododendron molle]|uniref:Uncharacterized protein n=1 Tax=Rhododendron molle TaxID=49168 RepID=A0ACC0P6C2_RHOML|nr:hypothetical protein RHMOL_Rhmol04G0250400 [Rhododendron molle]